MPYPQTNPFTIIFQDGTVATATFQNIPTVSSSLPSYGVYISIATIICFGAIFVFNTIASINRRRIRNY